MRKLTFALTLLLAAGCKSQDATSAPPAEPPPSPDAPAKSSASAPADQPTSAPASKPSAKPGAAAPGGAADVLATKLAAAAGNPYAVREIRFDFVVTDDGTEVLRRRHVWRPKAGTDAVTVGGTTTEVDELASRAAKPGSKDPVDAAYAAWVNDVFWLIAPAKLMDEGVNRTLDEDGQLTVSFDGVGLTPGDRYRYAFDPESHRVTGWTFELQGGSKGAFDWVDYERFGPLAISTRRPARDGERVISLENIAVEP